MMSKFGLIVVLVIYDFYCTSKNHEAYGLFHASSSERARSMSVYANFSAIFGVFLNMFFFFQWGIFMIFFDFSTGTVARIAVAHYSRAPL